MRKKRLILVLSVFMLGAGITCCAASNRKPTLQLDLTQFGYLRHGRDGPADYTTICFLSENLILVAINQRFFHGVDPLFSDMPESTVVIFDMSKRQAINVAHMRLLKSPRSVAPALNNHFLALTLSEVKLCSIEGKCDRSFATRGPLWVSWKRDKVVVGGNMRTSKVLLDSQSLMPLKDVDQDTVRIPAEQAPVIGRDGSWVESASNDDGARVIQNHLSHGLWSKMINPLVGFGDPPYTNQQVTVYDQRQNKEIFRLSWDPRPDGPGDPAISPTGHRIAFTINGKLQVFDIQ